MPFLVVKTVNVLGAAFPSATATFEGTPLSTTSAKGVLELPIPAGTSGGTVKVSVAGSWNEMQKVTFNFSGARPTIAFDGRQAINALRVAVASRGQDSNLEVHFVVDSDLRAALDTFHDRMSGPYHVNGTDVSAPPQFRMSPTAHGFTADAAHVAELDRIAAAAHVGAGVAASRAGRPTAGQIHAVTQALIDALWGHANPYPLTTTSGIRRMAFDYGVGIDCAGYVQQAFVASRHSSNSALGLNELINENLSGLSGRAPFRKIDVTRARTGDLIVLDPPQPRDVGHTVVVYTHRVEDDETALANVYGADARGLTHGWASGPAHLYYVDASWGSGSSGNPEGGVQRKPWTFNETTREWGWFDQGAARFATDRPYDHPLQAVFRPKREV